VSSSADRFARTAARLAARQDARAAGLAEEVRRFVLPRGDERALDVGTGAGALALALAPLVREVVGVDPVPELLTLARERAAGLANVELVEGDGTALPFEDFSFDLSGTLRTLHHVHRPELIVAELVRVTRPGGRVLVVDQLAPSDPLEALTVDRFERARDPGHERLLPDGDLRQLFEARDDADQVTLQLSERFQALIDSVATQLIAAYQHMIAAAHARRIRVYGATILPFGRSFYSSPEHEAARAAVNRWIRAGGQFDAVVDLDAAMRDPTDPTRLRADLDSGDHLHPNEAGYRVMADAFDLTLFTK